MSHTSLEGHEIVLLNPAHYDHFTEAPTEHGAAVLEKSAADIAQQFDKIVIVSSTEPRYAQSADLVGDFMHATVVHSEILDNVVNGSRIISDNLPELLAAALDEAGVELEDGEGVVWTAPSPLVAAAKGLSQLDVARSKVKYGEAVSYIPSRWRGWMGAMATQRATAESLRVAV